MSRFIRGATQDFVERFNKAQEIHFNVEKATDTPTYNFISTHASSIGCSELLMFSPLLAAVANCMGTKTTVEISSEWQEQIILWFIVAARSGEKKSLVFNRVKDAVRVAEEDLRSVVTSQPGGMETLLVDDYNVCRPDLLDFFEKHSKLNEPRPCLVMLDNFGSHLATGHLTPLHADVFLTDLYDGSRHTCAKSKLQNLHANFVAMTRARDAVAMFDTDDPDGLLERVLLLCTGSRDGGFSLLPCKMAPHNILSLQSVLSRVKFHHGVQEVRYTFSPDGKEQFQR